MTGAIASLAIGSDQVRGSGFAFDSLYFVGLLCSRSRSCSTWSPSGSCGA
jgi:hypothetical protein